MPCCCEGCEYWLCLCQNRNSANNFDSNEFPYKCGPRVVAAINFLILAAFIILVGVLGPNYGFPVSSTASIVAWVYAGVHVPPALLILIARTRRWVFVGYVLNLVLVFIDFFVTAYVLFIANCTGASNGTDCNWYISTSTPVNTYIFSMSITSSFWPRMAAFFGGCGFLSCILCWCSCVPIADCCRRCFGCSRPDDGEEEEETEVVVNAVDVAGVTLGGAVAKPSDANRIQSFGHVELAVQNPIAKVPTW